MSAWMRSFIGFGAPTKSAGKRCLSSAAASLGAGAGAGADASAAGSGTGSGTASGAGLEDMAQQGSVGVRIVPPTCKSIAHPKFCCSEESRVGAQDAFLLDAYSQAVSGVV